MSDDPFVPKGLTQRKSGARFNNKFASTVMGTAMFVAEMQRKVPLRTKLLTLVLALAVAGVGGWAWVDARDRSRSAEAITAALGTPHETGAPRVQTLLEEGLHSTSRASAYRYLGEAGHAPAVPLLVAALERSGEERKTAAEAIARIGAPAGQPAREPLAVMLTSSDPGEVFLAGWALVSLGDPRGLDVTLRALADGTLQQTPSYDAAKLATLLGRDGLIAKLGDANPVVRQFAATWLAPICDDTAVTALSSASRDPAQQVAVAACVSLGRCGTPAALGAIAAALASTPALREPLGQAFAHDVGAPGLSLLLQTTDDRSTRALLGRLISELFDPRAGDAFVAELERTPDPAGRIAIARALAEVGDARAAGIVAPLLADADDAVARQIVDMLGAIGEPSAAEPVLLDLLRTRRDLAGAVLVAMGEARACSAESVAAARGLLGASATQPWALGMLARCGDAAAGPVALRLLQRPGRDDGNAAFAAFDAVARLGLREASAPLYGWLENAGVDARLRLAAADALGLVGDDATLERVVNRLIDPGTPSDQRTALARALQHRVPASVLPRLMGYLRSGANDDRTLALVVVVGLAGDAALAPELATLLDDDRARANAAVALALGGADEGLRALAARMRADRALDEIVRTRVASVKPLFDARDLESGRLYDRLERLLRLRERGIGAFFDAYARALTEGSRHPGALSARELRRGLMRDLQGPDERKRRLAAAGLLAAGARGVLLAVRAGRGVGAVEADAVLSR
jgi:HEAT repeat protein